MESEHIEAMKYSLLLPQLISKVKNIGYRESKPLDLNTLMDDNTFRETIIIYINTQKGFISLYKYLQQLQLELIQLIEKEIDKK
ncbi:hypothetical protein APS56_13650 [Pseudalgibacter alginicilyticus]|uniref:Uncharacterized protein n=1 Tax=Pseudalgibacter alginicilyticus TaxID=1736674 RepID=A0A0P0DDH8_9FLAO|nr:hypothetical protein [Pseudalgibacter alginicilyticus]ALJ06108.1 hypothetical protein APS56_13650 [Pseudalgibacter alginicilyticus]